MGDLSKNISRSEVACRCGCGFDSMDKETIEAVQTACDYFKAVLRADKVVLDVGSGCRCENHNRAIGGSLNSQHVRARAMDISIRGVSPYDLAEFLEMKFSGQHGIGRYPGFVHIDTRTNGPARW